MYRLELLTVFVFVIPYITHLLKDVQTTTRIDFIVYAVCVSMMFNNVGRDYTGANKFKRKNSLMRVE